MTKKRLQQTTDYIFLVALIYWPKTDVKAPFLGHPVLYFFVLPVSAVKSAKTVVSPIESSVESKNGHKSSVLDCILLCCCALIKIQRFQQSESYPHKVSSGDKTSNRDEIFLYNKLVNTIVLAF